MSADRPDEVGPGRGPAVPLDVEISGVYNFRDLGGGVTASGDPVRRGVLYRSAALDGITADGLSALGSLGIRTVLDLRTATEIETHGRFPYERSAARWIHVPSPVGPGPGARSAPAVRRVLEHDDPMSVIYTTIVTDAATFVGEVIRRLADPANQPLVFHCTSGKDRTGVIAAVVQLVIGRDLDAVLADFERSSEFREQIRVDVMQRFAPSSELPDGFVDRIAGAERRWLLDALDLVGGPAGLDPWLDRIGVDAVVRAKLRRQMVG